MSCKSEVVSICWICVDQISAKVVFFLKYFAILIRFFQCNIVDNENEFWALCICTESEGN